jgi:hypothetical protein
MPPKGFGLDRRNALARARGFASYAQQRRFSPDISSRSELAKLPPAARQAREAALDAVALARRTGFDVAEAADREGVPVEAVRWWAGEDVVSRKGGRWSAAPADRLFRPMYVYSAGRVTPVDVRGSRVASDIGRYHAAIQHYLHTGDASRLAKFKGRRVGGLELEADLDVIDELARRGEFSFESIYRLVDE